MGGPHAGPPYSPAREVKEIKLGDGKSIYFVGDFSFDEADKDPEYIDRVIEAWTKWKEYANEHRD